MYFNAGSTYMQQINSDVGNYFGNFEKQYNKITTQLQIKKVKRSEHLNNNFKQKYESNKTETNYIFNYNK